ncbi:alpha/beta fold hydrolase [Novosphingobium bradum]|uniref:Alpha/beta fold hydrolase n=1 Tax=Novosphingobium bradum TaxID=1737444 RepID=A0ABV7ILP3_9SPHN
MAEDGWAIRRVDWGGKTAPRGSLLFLPGRGDFLEKYLESLDHWASRGWAVTALDWRGQALSGRLGTDSLTGHVDDFGRWVADLAAFWPAWVAERPGPHVLVAHSMGGHLALRAVAEGRVRPDALVLSAPMLGFVRHGLPTGLSRWLSRCLAALMCAIGDPRRAAWGQDSEKPGQVPAGRMALLTHDAARYADELWWRERRPGLGMGPPSWGWLRAALASMRWLDRRAVLSRLAVPTFIAAASADRLVDFGATVRAARWIPHARLLRFGTEAAHELLREADPVRGRVIAGIDEFLDQAAPADN